MTRHTPSPTANAQDVTATLRGLLCIQLRATAALQMQMSAALLGKGQDELRKHFADSAELLMRADKELTA